MDPTAAVAFENEPAEANVMKKPPRRASASLFSWKELGVSLFQGAAITVAVLYMYHIGVHQGMSEQGVRSMVFATLVSANIFLTLANRSFDFALDKTLFYKNNVLPFILAISALLLLLILYVPFLSHLFAMTALSPINLVCCVLAGFLSVIWFELYKILKMVAR